MKKFATLLLSISLLGSSASAFASFIDMPEGDTGVAMQAAVDNGLLNGYDVDGGKEIRPNGNITRAEMGTILVRAMGAEKTADISNFVDMNTSQWHYPYMSKAVAMGAFKGDTENKLNPENFITFQEAFVVLSRIFDLSDRKTTEDIKTLKFWKNGTISDEVKTMVNNNPTPEDPFSGYHDADLVADWAKEDFGNLLKFGYWKTDDGYLRPTEYITRAEFAKVMHNLVQTYIDEEDVIAKEIQIPDAKGQPQPVTVNFVNTEIKGNTVIRVKNSAVENFNDISSDIYIADGASGTAYFENTTLFRVVSKSSNVRFFDGYTVEIRITDPTKKAFLPAPPITNIASVDAHYIEFATKVL